MAGPNISTAIIPALIGVLAAPASRATKPIEEKMDTSKPKSPAKQAPAVEPTKKIGVTIPPLPPNDKVIEVKTAFKIKLYQGGLLPFSVSWMVSMPSPR